MVTSTVPLTRYPVRAGNNMENVVIFIVYTLEVPLLLLISYDGSMQ